MQKIIVIAIFLIGLSFRLYQIDLPLLEFNPSRQIQTADITRNFYRDGLNIFSPAVSYLGAEKQKFLVEFPLYNFSIASLYKIFANTNEYIGRLFSILGWAMSFILLYQLAKRYTGEVAALIAIFFYTFSPLSILTSRSFQPDQWMLSLSLASIYFADISKGKSLFFYLSILFSSLSFLIKITSILFTLIPVAYLIKNNQTKWPLKIIIFSCFSILPSFVWYLYASIVSRAGEVLTRSSEISNWFGLNLFWTPKYWANMFGFESNLSLLPIGLVLFFVGLTSRLKKNQYMLYFWLGSLALYFFIFNKHSMTHEYYHLPFLPIAAIFIGVGSAKLLRVLNNSILPKNFLIFTISMLILVLMLPPILARAYKPIDRFSYVLEVADIIKLLTDQNDLVIGLMDEGPSLVYYSDRSGWGFDIDPKKIEAHRKFIGQKGSTVLDPIDKLEELRSKGAVLFASSFKPQLLKNKEFSQYIYSYYPVLVETDNYVIFDLKSR